jgi:hypothetical protein
MIQSNYTGAYEVQFIYFKPPQGKRSSFRRSLGMMNWNTPRRIIFGLCLACLLLCFMSPVSAQALPAFQFFYGNVTIGGEPAPVGTLIEARGEHIVTPPPDPATGLTGNPVWTTEVGKYGGGDNPLVVQGTEDLMDGETIEFYINNVKADQNAEFHSGQTTQLDLMVESAPPVTPTPTPTVTPAVTPTATPTGTPSVTPTPTASPTHNVTPTPTTTPTPTPTPGGGGLSGGAVAGIVVGSLIAGALVMWLIMRRGG